MPRRVGVTMRHETAGGAAGEHRDVLASDWAALLEATLGHGSWLPIPNVGAAAIAFAERWKLDGLILTGGNDVGSCPERDETERALLVYFLHHRLPVLGVCRGLQLVQTYFGGSLREAGEMHDGGRLHAIRACHPRGLEILGRRRLQLASYHRHGVHLADLATDLEALALSVDGLVEALTHRTAALTAVQWHPERPLPDPAIATRLMRATLG